MSKKTDTFNTMQVRAWDKPQLKNSIEVTDSVHFDACPMGINWLDVDRSGNLRIQALIDNLKGDPNSTSATATVHLNAWHDTVLYSAGCTWLDMWRQDRDFQCGEYSTGGMSDNPNKPSIQVKFDKTYATTPKIVVWLKFLDVDKKANCRVKAHATDITKDGFKLNVETWGDTVLHKATASWIAHPSTRSNITSGNFNTMDVRAWDKPQHENEKSITFDKKFERPPRVLIAFNWFDCSNQANFRMKTLTKDVTEKGMTAKIESWFDTVMYSAGVSYLAIQDY
jgi:hypothetical protein